MLESKIVSVVSSKNNKRYFFLETKVNERYSFRNLLTNEQIEILILNGIIKTQ